jgi:hypothetical protein
MVVVVRRCGIAGSMLGRVKLGRAALVWYKKPLSGVLYFQYNLSRALVSSSKKTTFLCTVSSPQTLIFRMVDAATAEKLDAAFKKLQGTESKSLLKKYLTPEIFDKLKGLKTSLGATLLDVIQSGNKHIFTLSSIRELDYYSASV